MPPPLSLSSSGMRTKGKLFKWEKNCGGVRSGRSWVNLVLLLVGGPLLLPHDFIAITQYFFAMENLKWIVTATRAKIWSIWWAASACYNFCVGFPLIPWSNSSSFGYGIRIIYCTCTWTHITTRQNN